MRIAMGVEYDGTNYHGFQRQAAVSSVQDVLEKALSQLADEAIVLSCAGRTDAGVHALEQVIHFDTTATRSLRAWVLGTNSYLPHDVSVRWVQEVPDEFHSRFSALRRQYVYFLCDSFARPAVFRQHAAWHCRPLQVEAMQEAALFLLGKQDFSSFRSSECQALHPIRTVYNLTISRKNDFVVVSVQADAFLHHMVRNMVGTLLPVGEGMQAPFWVHSVLNARNRTAAGMTAPAEGLYLYKVTYPSQYQLPENKYFPFI